MQEFSIVRFATLLVTGAQAVSVTGAMAMSSGVLTVSRGSI